MRKALGATFCIAAVFLLQGPASAGGWWSHIGLDGQYLGVGESFTHRVPDVWFETIEDARVAQRVGYHAYLVEGFDAEALDAAMGRADPGSWWTPLGDIVDVGDVELPASDSNVTAATVDFTVPDIPPGAYYLMLCDAGCGTPLGNLIPAPVHVVAEPVAAATSRRLLKIDTRLDLAVAGMRHDARQLGRQIDEVRTSMPDPTKAIERLRGEVADRDHDHPVTTPWLAYAGWFIAGGALFHAIAGQRKKVWTRGRRRIDAAPTDASEPVVSH